MGHPHPEPGGDQGMAQLMERLGQDQGEGEAQQAVEGEGLHHGVGEAVPLLQGQQYAEQAGPRHQPGGEGAEQPVKPCRQPLEMALGAQQGDAEKQVVMQPPLSLQPGPAFARLAQPVHCLGAGTHQLMALEKLAEGEDLLHLGMQGRLVLQRLLQAAGRLPGPAYQTLELEPADAVEAVQHHALNEPGRLAVGGSVRRAESQIIAQARQGQVGGIQHQRPLQARRAARGRRSR
ncbi:hypothetical protein D3C79_572440 [compost metagenome]